MKEAANTGHRGGKRAFVSLNLDLSEEVKCVRERNMFIIHLFFAVCFTLYLFFTALVFVAFFFLVFFYCFVFVDFFFAVVFF